MRARSRKTDLDARALWDSIVAVGQLVLAGRKAHDLLRIANGDAESIAAIQDVVSHSNGVLRRLGARFSALAHDPDPVVAAFVGARLAELRAESARLPQRRRRAAKSAPESVGQGRVG